MRAVFRGEGSAWYEAEGSTYDEAKDIALKAMKLEAGEVRVEEEGNSENGAKVTVYSTRTRLEEAVRDLEMILDAMGIDIQVKGREEADLIFLDVEGTALGFLIGKNGATLGSLEYLMNIIHNRRFTPQCQILIDIDGYRQKDFQYVEKLIRKAVNHISKRGTSFELYPMSPKLRKLTHLLLRKFPGYESKSAGEGPDRRVEIRSISEEETQVFEEISIEHEGTLMEEGSEFEVRDAPTSSWDKDDEGSPLY